MLPFRPTLNIDTSVRTRPLSGPSGVGGVRGVGVVSSRPQQAVIRGGEEILRISRNAVAEVGEPVPCVDAEAALNDVAEEEAQAAEAFATNAGAPRGEGGDEDDGDDHPGANEEEAYAPD